MKLKKFASMAATVALATAFVPAPAQAQGAGDQFLGQLLLTGYNFCPRGWTPADGQLLAISTNTALFSLYGTTYGGDGRTTFALPDLRGRVPIHTGTGPGLSNHPLGQRSGQETHTLTTLEMPSHNHTAVLLGEAQVAADSANPRGNTLARGATIYADNAAPDPNDALHSGSVVVGNNGGNQAHNNMQPYLTLQWCVALTGIFPSRN